MCCLIPANRKDFSLIAQYFIFFFSCMCVCSTSNCFPFVFTKTLHFDKTLNWIKVYSLASLTKNKFPYLQKVWADTRNCDKNQTFKTWMGRWWWLRSLPKKLLAIITHGGSRENAYRMLLELLSIPSSQPVFIFPPVDTVPVVVNVPGVTRSERNVQT